MISATVMSQCVHLGRLVPAGSTLTLRWPTARLPRGGPRSPSPAVRTLGRSTDSRDGWFSVTLIHQAACRGKLCCGKRALCGGNAGVSQIVPDPRGTAFWRTALNECSLTLVSRSFQAPLQLSLQCQVSEASLVSHIFNDHTDDHRVRTCHMDLQIELKTWKMAS